MKIKMSLINRLVIIITSIIILFGVLAIIFVYAYSKDSFLDINIANFEELSLEQESETSLILNRASDLARVIATDEALSEFLTSPDQIKSNEILESFYTHNARNIYSVVYLIDKNGDTKISTDETFVGKNYAFRDYFKEALSGQSYIDVAVGVTSHELGYYFSYPVKNKNGSILGVVVLKMDPEVIGNSLEPTGLPRKIMIVDTYGVIIYSSNPDRLFSSLGKLSESDTQDIAQKRRYENLDIKPLHYQLVADNLDVNEEIVTLDFFDKVDNEAEIITIVRIGNLPFFIITEKDKDLYVTQAVDLALILSLFIFIAFLSPIFFVYIVIKRLLQPLNDLKTMAYKLKTNNFYYRITSISGSGDLVDIASSFNMAAENLKNNKINTEKLIAKRTSQLEKTNKMMVGRELKMIELKQKIKKLQTNIKNK